MLFLDKPHALDLMIAHAEQVCVPAPFAAEAAPARERPSLLQGPPLPVVWPAPFPAPRPAAPVAAAASAPEPAAHPHPPIAIGTRGWTAA